MSRADIWYLVRDISRKPSEIDSEGDRQGGTERKTLEAMLHFSGCVTLTAAFGVSLGLSALVTRSIPQSRYVTNMPAIAHILAVFNSGVYGYPLATPMHSGAPYCDLRACWHESTYAEYRSDAPMIGTTKTKNPDTLRHPGLIGWTVLRAIRSAVRGDHTATSVLVPPMVPAQWPVRIVDYGPSVWGHPHRSPMRSNPLTP